jgi:hypothetical protein
MIKSLTPVLQARGVPAFAIHSRRTFRPFRAAMDDLSPQVIIIFGVIFIYFILVIVLMVLSLASLRYRRIKFQDESTLWRFLLIPITLPFRIVASILLSLLKIVKWLSYIVLAMLGVILFPFYVIFLRPLRKFIYRFDEALRDFDKFVVFFRFGIRLGHWLMFYKAEPIDSKLPSTTPNQFYGTRVNRPQPCKKPNFQ